jgi:hypothetical protein
MSLVNCIVQLICMYNQQSIEENDYIVPAASLSPNLGQSPLADTFVYLRRFCFQFFSFRYYYDYS